MRTAVPPLGENFFRERLKKGRSKISAPVSEVLDPLVIGVNHKARLRQ